MNISWLVYGILCLLLLGVLPACSEKIDHKSAIKEMEERNNNSLTTKTSTQKSTAYIKPRTTLSHHGKKQDAVDLHEMTKEHKVPTHKK